MDNTELKWLIALLAAAALAALAWFLWDEIKPPPEPVPVGQ
ncbi:MAG TPA: hypothetical protein VLS87_00830 [Woeseiaceae bacterium]|nr:hypothetical protein [Woeseiaceae bacterium]